MSPDNRRLRFLSAGSRSAGPAADTVCAPARRGHRALLAERAGQGVGLVEYHAEHVAPHTAELAVAVADGQQDGSTRNAPDDTRRDTRLMYRNDGFRELNRQESLQRLANAPVGRIVHTRDALPAVLPVNFVLEKSGAVLLRTSASSELVRAVDGAVVAFEADEVDAVTHSGWSVVVTGLASVVTDPGEHEQLVRTGPRSWVPWPVEVFVRIAPDLVSGRELVGGRTLYGLDPPS